MGDLIKQQLTKIQNLNSQYIFWTRIGFLTIILGIVAAFQWDYIKANHFAWAISGIIICLIISWWVWTMLVIKKLISYKNVETEIIDELIKDIREIKENVKKTFHQ